MTREEDITKCIDFIRSMDFTLEELAVVYRKVAMLKGDKTIKLFKAGDVVEFKAKYHGMRVKIEVQAINKHGIINGRTEDGVSWNVASSKCRLVMRKEQK